MQLLNVMIDLSHHNTVTSFQDIKGDGILGIIHKATEGTDYVDKEYDSRAVNAKAVGLFRGAYHFGTRGNAKEQADHFLSIVNPSPADLLVLDFEPNPHVGTMTVADAETFVLRIKEQTGRYPGLYSGQAFLEEQFGGGTSDTLKNCFLWIARYSSALPGVTAPFETFTVWQYTDGNAGPQPHEVRGVGSCDRDKFNGDEAGLRKFWGIE
jgi:lysozyme